MTTDRRTLEAALSDADFPAGKEQLVSYAENHGVDAGAVRALRAMPPAEYANVAEVLRSAPLDKAAEEGQSSSDKARQAGQDAPSGLAEHQRATRPNPIVEELGENRGS
ncbi:DUF2795 domain-containing protein [Amycolatopsis cihanbeyliensis]|uniref:Uncharacterized protein DUF2795 n=1 Tax=Amycolatopsis cihanbeyliensis TaxID=1128664 RepID=A0A542DBI8_AMYCI|nr:DUF2795 domain-containing protein [Amycolatopsis cihanbeyliensis]TQJ00432.1 uncharacterized protein DUF2795 [Amycolatopsis cihanbeyliensis]